MKSYIERLFDIGFTTLFALLFVWIITFWFGSSGNLGYIQKNSAVKWAEVGFKPIGYLGYEWGKLGYGSSYGGAKVSYELRKIPDNDLTYVGTLTRWGDELHVNEIKPRDGAKPVK